MDAYKSRTAMEMLDDYRPDLRRERATQLAHLVVSTLGPVIDAAEAINPRARREAYDALLELFGNGGFDVVTDSTRAEVGLPSRDDRGWTKEELFALEAARTHAILRPLGIILPAETAPAPSTAD